MHYSIWKGLSLVGKENNPLFKGKARRESKINRKPSRPTGLYVWVLFHLKLGLGRVPLNYGSIIINNTRKEMDSPAGEKGKKGKKGGGKRRLRIVTPLHG